MKAHLEGIRWVAVKVERGFPVKVRGFRRKHDAEKQERTWRKTMNLDYDESEVLPLVISDI